MKKTTTILISVLIIAGLTSLILYRKHLKVEAKAQQEQIERETARRVLQQQKEAKIAKFEEEQKRRNDSIANAQTQQLNEGLDMLKEAMENLKE